MEQSRVRITLNDFKENVLSADSKRLKFCSELMAAEDGSSGHKRYRPVCIIVTWTTAELDRFFADNVHTWQHKSNLIQIVMITVICECRLIEKNISVGYV